MVNWFPLTVVLFMVVARVTAGNSSSATGPERSQVLPSEKFVACPSCPLLWADSFDSGQSVYIPCRQGLSHESHFRGSGAQLHMSVMPDTSDKSYSHD